MCPVGRHILNHWTDHQGSPILIFKQLCLKDLSNIYFNACWL